MVVFMCLCWFHGEIWRFWWKIDMFMYVYVISPGFSYDFGSKYGDFNVYVISPGFSVCFHKNSAPIWPIFRAQMRFTGEFTFIPRRCLRALTSQNLPTSTFMGFRRGFRLVFTRFRHVSFTFSGAEAFGRQIRLPSASAPSCYWSNKSIGLDVYGLSPRFWHAFGRFPGCFTIISSPISGADAFRREIHLPTASAPLRHLPSRTTNLCVYGISPRFLHVCAIIILHYSRIEIRQKPRPRKRLWTDFQHGGA